MKLMMVVSPGGHLLKLVRLKSWWDKYERVWVTDTGIKQTFLDNERVISGYFPENRNIKNSFKNLWLAIKVVRKEKPKVMISTGAGIAVPFFIIGKLMRVKLIFIETFMYISKPTISGKILYYLADEFIIQNRGMLEIYPKAHLAEAEL